MDFKEIGPKGLEAGSCVHSNEHSGSIEVREFINQLSYYQLLRTLLH
jgi:hypothetical protein